MLTLALLGWRKGPDGVSLVDGCGMSPSVMYDALFLSARRASVPFRISRVMGAAAGAKVEDVLVSFSDRTIS